MLPTVYIQIPASYMILCKKNQQENTKKLDLRKIFYLRTSQMYKAMFLSIPEWFGELLLRWTGAHCETWLHPLPPRHPALSEGHEGHHGMYHQHQQRAICICRRGGAADTAAEVDAVLRFRHVHTLPRLLFRVRPGLVGRQVIYCFIPIIYNTDLSFEHSYS